MVEWERNIGKYILKLEKKLHLWNIGIKLFKLNYICN